MRDAAGIEARIDCLAAAAAAGEGGPAFVCRLEDALVEGYAEALRLDGERRRLDRRIDELADAVTDAAAARELHRLARRQRTVAGHASALRERLGLLREHFVALGGTRLPEE